MQTFLPYSSFQDSAHCLDKKRCFKQVVEASQLIKGLSLLEEGKLEKGNKFWQNHPCFKMWIGHTNALIEYYNVFYSECKLSWKINFVKLSPLRSKTPIIYPKWLGLNEFHASHRSNLLRKNPVYYGKYGWLEPDNLVYYWPNGEESPFNPL